MAEDKNKNIKVVESGWDDEVSSDGKVKVIESGWDDDIADGGTVKKKVESGTSVPSPYPMGRGPLASPIQIGQREEIETPTWQQQKEVERKRAGASVPAKSVVPKVGYEPTAQEQLKKIEAMTFQVKYPEYEKPEEFDFAAESARAITEEDKRRVEEGKQRSEQKRLQSLPREIEKLKAERNELVLDKSPDAKSRIAALDAVAKKYERDLKKAQQPQYATLANLNQKAIKGLEEEANAYLDGSEAQNSLNALIDEANRLYYDDSPESQQRLAENERQRVKLEAEILKSGKLKSKLDRVGLSEFETYELLQSSVAQKILPLEADIQAYAKEGTVELAKQKADLAKRLNGLQDKALPIAEKIKTLQNEYLNKNGYAELNKQIAEAEQKIKSYEPFVKGAQAKQKLYQQDIDNLESQLQSYASLIEGDYWKGTQQQLDRYKEIAKDHSVAVAGFNNAWKITELEGYEDAANLYNSLTEKRKSLTQGLLNNADYAKATSELEGIMGEIKTSAEEYKQYDAPEVRNRINGFLNTANKINEYDEKLKAARGKLTSVEEVKKAQDAYNASGIGGDWADVGGRAVNSIVGTLNKLVASPFRIAASLSDAVDNKYGFSDYVADLIEGEPFMVKETNVLYDPVTDKINWGVMPVLKSLADQVGIITVLGVSGRVATPAYSRLLSKQSADLFRQSAIVDEAVAATTIAPAFMISYGEQYKAALEKGFTAEQASVYGGAMSLIEGLSELILPDQKLLFGKETSDVLMSRFVKNYAKGKKYAIKQLVLDFAENAGSETVEEQMPMIGEMLGTFIGNYVNEDIKIEIPTINQQINTDLVAALSGGLMGLSGKISDDRRLYKKSVADLAVDFTRSKELLDAFKKKGLIDPNRYDKLVSDVQKYQSIRGKIPQGLGRFQTLDIGDKMLQIYDLASKIDDQDKNNPMNEIYRKKMKQLQGDIESIIDDKDYESKAEAEYNEELQEYVRSTEEVIENIRQTAVPVEQIGKVVLQKYTSGTSKIYGYIDRGDGKGKVELTEEEFLAEQSGLTRLIREQRDLEIQELEKIRPDLTDQDLLLTDLPVSVDKTLDRVYEGTPTDPVQIQEAIDALDKKFDELEAYKKDPKRTHTTEVIDSLIDVLSEAKSTLQRYENEVRPTEARAEEGAGKPEVPSAKGITPEQKAAGGEVTTPSVPAIEAAEDISKEDENYRQSREVTEAVSKENPDASVLITPRGNDLNLAAVYVGKEKRGKGIGSKVLDSVKRQADRLGKKVVLDATNELDEETDLEKLGKFYERNGFVKVGENKYEYNPPKGGGIAAPSVPAIETKPTQYDKENIQGVSGEERVGQEPKQAKPEQKGGAEAPTAGGILQATEEEIAATAKALEGVEDSELDRIAKSGEMPIKLSDTKELDNEINRLRSNAKLLRDKGKIEFAEEQEQAANEIEKRKSLVPLKAVQLSEAYHKAKADGSNPELVEAVEELLKPTTDETKTETKDGEPLPKGVSGIRPEGEGREKGAELRPEAEEEVDAEREELLMTGEAEERREKGRYTKDGVEYVRQKPDKGIRGNKGEVRFAKGIEVPFTYKLIERKRAQASHRSGLRNPMHFVPETQPKNRTDKESIAAELDFANNPDWLRLGAMPDAYSGAPIVLPTDEGIQGHNRLAGLSLGYSFGNMAYKEMLVENAEQFGFTKEQVMAMEEPILVREVNVSDEYAIELGNYKYADLETGGIGRIDPVSLVRRIPVPRKLQLMDLVITDDTINASIRKNFTEVYNILRRYLNSAQRSGLMKPDGEPTTSAVMEIETLINQFLFDGGDVSLSEIFENLPYNAREGLKRSLRYLLVADKKKSLLPEVQEAIVIMRKFELSGAKSFETFLVQIDAFNPDYPTPSDLYDPVAIEIARRIIPERKITAIPLIFGEYKNLTIGKKKPKKGEQFQAGMSFPTEGETQEEEVILTKAEAIQTLFNIDYEKESKFKRRESAKRGGAEVSEQEVPAEPKEPAEPQKPAGAEVKAETPAQAPTSVPADLASAISQTSELYSRIYDPETTAKEKREIKNQIKEMLKDYPYLEYIYNNIKDINSQLENLGMLTKEGDCP